MQILHGSTARLHQFPCACDFLSSNVHRTNSLVRRDELLRIG